MTWYADVEFEWGALDRVIEWCKRCVNGTVVWQMIEPPATLINGQYRFFFVHEPDYLLFILTWS